jgi:hypothetical protein
LQLFQSLDNPAQAGCQGNVQYNALRFWQARSRLLWGSALRLSDQTIQALAIAEMIWSYMQGSTPKRQIFRPLWQPIPSSLL